MTTVTIPAEPTAAPKAKRRPPTVGAELPDVHGLEPEPADPALRTQFRAVKEKLAALARQETARQEAVAARLHALRDALAWVESRVVLGEATEEEARRARAALAEAEASRGSQLARERAALETALAELKERSRVDLEARNADKRAECQRRYRLAAEIRAQRRRALAEAQATLEALGHALQGLSFPPPDARRNRCVSAESWMLREREAAEAREVMP